jgi:Fic family protein
MDWRAFTWDSQLQQEMLQRIAVKHRQLLGMRPISSAALARIRDSFAMEWTYHSNSIEGNTLTLQETRLVLEDGITVGGKSLREHFEILNHHDAISFIEKQAQKGYRLNAGDILSVHRLVLQRIEKEFAGRYRNSGVRITGANFTPPNALKVDDLMDELLSWVNAEQNLPLPVKATIFHHRFVWIHPFFDGNGRTVRLLFNLLLMSEGYPPAIILQQDRKKYYDALNKANNGSYEKLVTLILQALERSLDIYISQLNNTYEDFRPISTIVEEEKLPYGQEYISLLVRQGKIAGYKEGKNWLTTEDAILTYMHKRKRIRKAEK